jgi:hypothetical protein
MYSSVELFITVGEIGSGRDGMPRQSRIFLMASVEVMESFENEKDIELVYPT